MNKESYYWHTDFGVYISTADPTLYYDQAAGAWKHFQDFPQPAMTENANTLPLSLEDVRRNRLILNSGSTVNRMTIAKLVTECIQLGNDYSFTLISAKAADWEAYNNPAIVGTDSRVFPPWSSHVSAQILRVIGNDQRNRGRTNPHFLIIEDMEVVLPKLEPMDKFRLQIHFASSKEKYFNNFFVGSTSNSREIEEAWLQTLTFYPGNT